MKSTKHEKIVDQAMARIENETMVSVEGDHFTVCDFTMKDGQPGPLGDLLHVLLKNAVTRVKERTQSCMAILTSGNAIYSNFALLSLADGLYR